MIELFVKEWDAFRDQQTRSVLGISGEEFLRRWQADEYAETADDSVDVSYLIILYGGGGR